MADWLETYHENVHPVGDPTGLWSGRASMRDEDTMDLDLYVRMPLNHIVVRLVKPGEVEDAVQQSGGVLGDEGT